VSTELEVEIDRNLFAFLPHIPKLVQEHKGQYAILKNQEVVSIHDRLSEALEIAQSKFADGLFSIQQVTDKPVELGFFSYANHSR
jgi:Family of unknown function (DUF5678)